MRGEVLPRKKWIRAHIVNRLDWKYSLFWDRDSIVFGESIDLAIQNALASRPLKVFCLCDNDYINAAKKAGSGLHQELDLLSKLSLDPDAKIIPILLEKGCQEKLPAPLIGRAYIDLIEFRERKLFLGNAMLHLADDVTQAEMLTWMRYSIFKDDLYKLAKEYFHRISLCFTGNARTHQVSINHMQPLLAPRWMWDSNEWNYMLNDEHDTYCPAKGRWHWGHFSPGRSMQSLGTAIIAQFFPHDVKQDMQWAIEDAGRILALSFISMVRQDELFILDVDEIIMHLMRKDDGCQALEHLLNEYS